MNRRRFREVVESEIAALPALFRDRLANVEVVVEDEPTDEQIVGAGLDPEEDTILGLYEGTPLPDREHNHSMMLPDRIFLFYGPLLDVSPDEATLREEIRTTVIHEVAHFFGLDDEEIEDLGY